MDDSNQIYAPAQAGASDSDIPLQDMAPGFPFSPETGEHFPVFPIAPEWGFPVSPGPDMEAPDENTPVFPIAPEWSAPVSPGPDENTPVFPVAPEPGVPVYPGPGTGTEDGALLPDLGYARIRFLHAAANYPTFSISVGSRVYAMDLAYGTLSGYEYVPEGFRTITIMTRSLPRRIVFRQSFPFIENETLTLAIVNSPNGIEIVPVSDNWCRTSPTPFSCFRMVGLSYNSPPLDLVLQDGRVVFTDVHFKEVTRSKRVLPREYEFFLIPTPATPMPLEEIETLDSAPRPVSEGYIPGYGDIPPILTFSVDIARNSMVTVYIIGDFSAPPYLRALVVENT